MSRSQRAREGYLQIDHTNSPGLNPEEVRRVNAQSGKDFKFVPEGMNYESATRVCCHCGVPVVLNPDRSRPRGYCHKCDAYHCDKIECQDCIPFKKIMNLINDTPELHNNPNLTIEMLRRTILNS